MCRLCHLLYFHRASVFVIFFFKQKTAYEMRISDWSSDVCSSDLNAQPGRGRRAHRAAPPRLPAGNRQPVQPGQRADRLSIRANALADVERRPVLRRPDRKSVVEGKRVAVRVDFGGRRTITKKQNSLKNKQISNTHKKNHYP